MDSDSDVRPLRGDSGSARPTSTMKETVIELVDLAADEGREVRQIYLPIGWFDKLATELGIKPIPTYFTFLGIPIKYTHTDAVSIYFKAQ